jgi:proline iminopeptidase
VQSGPIRLPSTFDEFDEFGHFGSSAAERLARISDVSETPKTPSYQPSPPLAEGMLDVGDGHRLRWMVSGNPDGKPAVLLHGGPGSGLSENHRRMFDPARYRIVQFDQRNCGQSTPSAGAATVDLSTNTTPHLIADIETLRVSLKIDRWLVWGGSWGSTLALAYTIAHPGSVTELMLSAVCSTSEADVVWVTRTMGRLFPERWQSFVNHLPPDRRDGNLALAYNALLMDPDPAVHHPAALAWCQWEDTHVSLGTIGGSAAASTGPGLVDATPEFRLCFARLVTHYWANGGFLADGHLLANASKLATIPTFLAHGRRDVSSPIDFSVALAQKIPGAELFISETDGHGGPTMTEHMVALTDRLAGP